MATQKILKNYSYALLIMSGALFIYSVFRVVSCTAYGASVYTDFCKLAGLAIWNFYGLPIMALSLIGIILPKLSESDKVQKLLLAFMALSTARFTYLVLSAVFAKTV